MRFVIIKHYGCFPRISYIKMRTLFIIIRFSGRFRTREEARVWDLYKYVICYVFYYLYEGNSCVHKAYEYKQWNNHVMYNRRKYVAQTLFSVVRT